jgi:serine/threonine protein kinase
LIRLLKLAVERKPDVLGDMLQDGFEDDFSLEEKLRTILSGEDNVSTIHEPVADWAELETTLRPGEKIGAYEVLESLGEGGMGVVVKAQQHKPVKRMVALKIIKSGMSSKRVLRRFQMEQQTLAGMSHPYIAQVFDAGVTENRRPYFVMEFIDGTPLDVFCDERKLDLQRRLALFIEVTDAIRYAHQRGIVHRDLKPANILVVESEGAFIPKIIDFGIAKALHAAPEADKSMLTQVGTTMGSPGYMSPEQARTNEVEIDTRTDIFSLGVILFELVTGFLPDSQEQFKARPLDEVLEMIIHKPAPRPSDLLKDCREQLGDILVNRTTNYTKLRRAVKGDLDWIILKALEKDKSRRYETASAFQNDIEHYLKGRPVLAGPPGIGYQFKKFVQRNKVLVAAFSLLALSVIGGIVGTTQGFFSARQEAETAKQTLSLLQEFLTSSRTAGPNQDLKVTELLDLFLQRLDRKENLDPEVMGSIKYTIASSYFHLSIFDKTEALLLENIAFLEENGGDFESLWLTKEKLADFYWATRAIDRAIPLYQEILEHTEQLYGETHPNTLMAVENVAAAYRDKRDFDQAKYLYDSILVHKAELEKQNINHYLHIMESYAFFLSETNKNVDALELYEKLEESHKEEYREFSDRKIELLKELAREYKNVGDRERSLEIEKKLVETSERKYGRENVNTNSTKANYAWSLISFRQYEEALFLLEEVWEVEKKLYGNSHLNSINSLNSLTRAYYEAGKLEESKRKSDELLRLCREAGLTDSSPYLHGMRIQALILQKQGHLNKALEAFKETLAKANQVYEPDHVLRLMLQIELAHVYRKLGNEEQFLSLFFDSHQHFRKRYHGTHRTVFGIFRSTVMMCDKEGDTELAKEVVHRMKMVYEKEYGKESVEMKRLHDKVPEVLREAQD